MSGAYNVARSRRERVAIARKAGLASGRARRATARGRREPHARDRANALALTYPVQQLTRAQFDQRYSEWCEAQGLFVSERGLLTVYALYRTEIAAYRAKGQDLQTTNGQRARGLASRQRPRCTRTVQRTRQRLESMGLITYKHVRRRGAMPGFRDSLRVRMLCRSDQSFVTPPSAARAKCPSGTSLALALRQEHNTYRSSASPPTGIAPAAPARARSGACSAGGSENEGSSESFVTPGENSEEEPSPWAAQMLIRLGISEEEPT